MLTAYYSRGCDSAQLFQNLKIAKDENYPKYRNQFNTISLNMQEFLSRSSHVEQLIWRLKKAVIRELKKEYPAVDYFDEEDDDVVENMESLGELPVYHGRKWEELIDHDL